MKYWRVLGIGNDPLVFWSVKQELLRLSPGCLIDLVTTFEDGQELLLMYSYDVVIADFGSPVIFDLTALIMERGFPVVGISQNGFPAHLADTGIACVVHPESPEQAALAALSVLRHQGFLNLRRSFKNVLMWPYRRLLQLVPKKPREVPFCSKLLLY